MKPTYEKLIELNPYLKNMGQQEVEKLVEAILECGYEWNAENNCFWHPRIKKGIKTSGLDMFTAEKLKEIFEKSWDNDDWQRENTIRQTCVKSFLFSIVLFLVSLTSFSFLDWKISITGLFVAICIGIISEKIKKQSLMRDDGYIDPKKIIWCKTCKHLKKIKGWDTDLWQAKEICDGYNIPCKKYDETKRIWFEYFNTPEMKRTLYPGSCPDWEK